MLLHIVQDFLRLDRSHIIQGWDRLRNDLCLTESLDVTEFVDFASDCKAERTSLSSGTSGTPDSVYIILVILRDIVVEYRFHVVHVDSSCSDIRCNKNLGRSVPEAAHNAVSLLLL